MSAYLHLLGRPRVEHAGTSIALPAERRCQLLVLLALRRGWVPRSELSALFWPGHRADLAAANVRKALHLARALPWTGALETQGSAVRFLVATDLHEVEQAMREGRVADALQGCGGQLLDGLDDVSNSACTDWLDTERAQHARRWHELTRTRLAQLEADPRQAAAFARRLLDADPLDEDAVVALLAAHASWALRRAARGLSRFRDAARRRTGRRAVAARARSAGRYGAADDVDGGRRRLHRPRTRTRRAGRAARARQLPVAHRDRARAASARAGC